MDNDAYGHVNNVVYYSWFDTVVNEYLIAEGVLDVTGGAVIGLVVETQCRYFSELAFPQPVDLGLRIGRLGTSSVRYEIGVFAEGAATASAQGHFVHVYVDRASKRPTALPAPLRAALERIQA
jgi:acyl-CoA thioester hydrolase